jgi:hypothetical protein
MFKSVINFFLVVSLAGSLKNARGFFDYFVKHACFGWGEGFVGALWVLWMCF